MPIFHRLFRIFKQRITPPDAPSTSDDLKATIAAIQSDIAKIVGKVCNEKFDVTCYGAYHIHPKYLVFWVCIQTDSMKSDLKKNTTLFAELRALLDIHNYPAEGKSNVFIGFESQETVDRESKGNWYHHFK